MIDFGEHERDFWHGAACGPETHHLFFDPDTREEAIAICEGCPIRERCREYAIESNQLFGVWGGTIPYERYKIRKERQ